MPKRKHVSLEKYVRHQSRAALLIPMAIVMEMLLSLGVIVGVVSGSLTNPFGLAIILSTALFSSWMGYNLYHYIIAIKNMGEYLRWQEREHQRIERLMVQQSTTALEPALSRITTEQQHMRHP